MICELTVIIPAYNEEQRLGPRLGQVLEYLRVNYPAFELIVVDDGSHDGTAALVQAVLGAEPRARLITYQPNRGKGYAIRQGMLASHGAQVIFMDADLSTPLDEIPRALAHLQQAPIVIGSRDRPDAGRRVHRPFHRRLASGVFKGVRYLMVGLWHLSDTQCGFKAYRGEVARQLYTLAQIDRFMFDVEILYLADRAHVPVIELPVRWTNAPGSTVRFWEGLVHMARDLWRIRMLHRGKIVIREP